MSGNNNVKEIILSDEQKRAAHHDGNTIVSAGAGCGKSTTMIERIVDKIKKGVPLSDMLIVTFTRASAADIKEKLALKLSQMLENNPKNEKLSEALHSIPVSDIGTLHSFCQRLIRTYFYAADIDPGRTVCDERDAVMMKSASVRAALRDAVLGDDTDFRTICEMMSDRRSDAEMEKVLLKVMDFALSLPEDENYFEKIKTDSAYYSEVDKVVDKKRTRLIDKINGFRLSVEMMGIVSLLPAIDELILYVNTPAAVPTFMRKPSVKKEPFGEEKSNEFDKLKKKCKDFIAYKDGVEKIKRLDSTKYARAIMRVASDALSRYAVKKEERGVIDYSDLEHGASRILSDEACLKEITSRIKYVFVDEYQDVNPLQNSIVEKFKNEGAEIFLVGDIKQSIYGFRRCDPKYFDAALGDKSYTRFDLTENRRSYKNIVDFINTMFSAVMTEKLGGVKYDKKAALKAMSDKPGVAEFVLIDRDASVSIIEPSGDECAAAPGEEACKSDDVIIETKNGDEIIESKNGDEPLQEDSGEEKSVAIKAVKPYSVKNAKKDESKDPEAYYIAQRILELTEPDKDGKRKVDFGQITILLRAMAGPFASQLVDALVSVGIPVSIERKSDIGNFPEAVALLDIARCVDTSMDDLALYTALRSPMGGFSDEELAEIAAVGKKAIPFSNDKKAVPFWRKVAAYDGPLGGRLAEFFALRDKFREYAVCHDAADTLGYITSRIDYFQHVYTMEGSGHSATAVEALITCAAERNCDLHSFVSYCSAQGFALEASATSDTVKIETIHSSKGIEYDYCFVAQCSKGFNFKDAAANVIIDTDGIAIKIPDDDGNVSDSIPYIAAQAKAKDNTRSEEMRMLYVALTRAKKMLIVSSKTSARESEDPQSYLDYFKAVPGITPVRVGSIVIKKHKAAAPECTDLDAIERDVRSRCSFVYPRERDKDNKLIDINPDTEHKKVGAIKPVPIKTSVTAVAEWEEECAEHNLADTEERGGERVIRRVTSASPSDKYAGFTAGEISRLRGTAYHRVMELIDFNSSEFDECCDEDAVIKNLFDSVKDEVDNFDLVDEKAIITAVKKMRTITANAKYVLKERYFIADIPLDEFDGKSVLVQGVIDLLTVDEKDNVTIVDYKTTAESGLNSEGYKTQLKLYKKAVELTTKYASVQTKLYSFIKEDFIPVD